MCVTSALSLSLIACVEDTVPIVTEETSGSSESGGYTLFSPMNSTDTYLIDYDGVIQHTWTSSYSPGLSVYLQENGELIRPGVEPNLPTTFSDGVGGTAGIIEILDWDSSVIWSTSLATEDYMSHHDVEVLPSGNLLVVIWEAKTDTEALALGRTSVEDDTLWAGAIYEICRADSVTNNTCTDKEIVWSWSVWDHLVQDQDNTLSTYGNPIDNTDKIDLNYFSGAGKSDWTHFNSVDYDEDSDHIIISVHNFDEYWIIDHNDNTQGILTRVGNPEAYGGVGDQTLFVQHDAHWIENGLPGAGNILVFNNGKGRSDGDYSSVDEFCYEGTGCTPGEIVDSYSEGSLGGFYSSSISGAQRLENGNTLVCEGKEGYLFEYDTDHNVVWDYQYSGANNIFRATRFSSDYAGLSEL